MLIKMTHVGGPLDGSIEFEEGSAWPTNVDHVYSLARGTYDLTNGEIGKGALSASPAVNEARRSGNLSDDDAKKSTKHFYYITSNEIRDGVRHVTAEHKPEYRG